MADTAQRRSPLDQLDPTAWSGLNGVSLREERFLSQVNLRVNAASAVGGRVARVLGIDLPVESNTTSTDGARHVLWLGPDEWLVVAPDGDAAAIEMTVHEALSPDWGSVVDVSANRTVIEVSGSRARELLSKGCSLDLHPRTFRPGMCAQTLLAKTAVILWQSDDVPTFNILVRASFATYLADWLTDAAAEYRQT